MRSDSLHVTPEPRKTVYLLTADNVWAKLFRTETPYAELELISHRINFVGRAKDLHVAGGSATEQGAQENDRARRNEDFCRALCRVLKSDYQAGKFDELMIIACSNFLDAMLGFLEGECSGRVFGKVMEKPGLLTEQELIAQLRESLAGATAVKSHLL